MEAEYPSPMDLHNVFTGVTMSNFHYNWKRFWCLRTGNLNLSDGGFLSDPDSEYGRIYSHEVLPFENIIGKQCLALLGEPGIGKSRAMQIETEAILKTILDGSDKVLKLDLRSFGSEERLIKDLFDNSEFDAWIKGDYHLHLFLDSLDECLLRIDTLATLLLDEFEKYPIERLKLRIACRTAEWPATLENGLRRLWGISDFEAYELAPLRKADVIEAVKVNGIDPECFLEEIFEKAVVSFAIKPVTLQFLINTFKKDRTLPSTQSELYYIGCLKLCEEQSQQRIDGKLSGKYTASQRFAIASRIAAITQFTNRYAIWTGRDLGNVPIEDIAISELFVGKEVIDGKEFDVTEIALRETLDSGLFSSRGQNRMGWAHQTYAEFLAASYIVQHNVALPKIKTLINSFDDHEGKLVPQLHETAAWISSMRPEVFMDIIRTDPDVLLRSDIAKTGVKEKEALVHALLTQSENEKLFDRNIGTNHYKKLCHPQIADQLLPFICSCTNLITRRIAIDIAEACVVQELQQELISIVFNVSECFMIRNEAAHAISRIASDDVKVKMMPLARGEAGDDPDDELKGAALTALWPSLISAEDLFELLTPPKNESLYGSYKYFIIGELNNNLDLNQDELVTALNWVKKQSSRRELSYDFKGLVDAIMLKAWEQIEVDKIAKNFTEAVLPRLMDYDSVFEDSNKAELPKRIANDDNKRRIILLSLLQLIPEQKNINCVSYSSFAISSDMFWMIEQLHTNLEDDQKNKLVEIIQYIFDIREVGHIDAVLTASLDIPMLSEKFAWLINPVFPGTPEADMMKAEYIESQKLQSKRQKKALLQPLSQERVSMCLSDFEAGDPSGWWRMQREMTLESTSEYYGDELEADLSILPGWKTADDKTKERIIKAAIKYLTDQDPIKSEWLGTNTLYRPAFAGFRAFILLVKFDPCTIVELPIEVWDKWSSVILAYPTNDKHIEVQQNLVRMAYSKSPSEIIETLKCLIDKENREHNHIFITRLVEQCWDDRISKVLLQIAKDEGTKPENMGCLLDKLFEHSFDEAIIFAESLLSIPITSEVTERKRATIAAKELFHHNNAGSWTFLWQIFQQDQQFGKEVVLQAADRQRIGTIGMHDQITEMQFAELYVWITNIFPHCEDPKHKGVHSVGPNENVRYFRDGILRQLQQRGTKDACKAIEYIIDKFPKLNWLKSVLIDAKAQARQKSWHPLSPQEVLNLVNKQRHVVFLIHGIRTQGEWEQQTASILQSDDSVCVRPIRYEFFDSFRFLLPLTYFRKKPVQRIVRLIRDEYSRGPALLSVIAHSYGTYIFAKILEQEADIRFNRLILCGSILPDHFKWELYGHRFESVCEGDWQVVNDCGKNDIWPVIAKSVTWGFGSSGRFGFGHNRVKDRYFNATHSSFFNEDFVRNYWLPYISKGKIVEGVLDRETTPLWVSFLTVIKLRYIILIVFILAAYIVFSW